MNYQTLMYKQGLKKFTREISEPREDQETDHVMTDESLFISSMQTLHTCN